MNHLLPVWWSTFRFRFLIDSWCVNVIWWKSISIDVFLLFLSLCITHVLPNMFSSQITILQKTLYTKYFVLSYSINVFSTLSYMAKRTNSPNLFCILLILHSRVGRRGPRAPPWWQNFNRTQRSLSLPGLWKHMLPSAKIPPRGSFGPI